MSDSWMIFLGTSAGVPNKGRMLPAILLQYRGKYILLDAGEGAQIALSKYGMGASKIDAILVSHMHGDHIFGLPGLIQTMGMGSRKKPLIIMSPSGLKDFLDASFNVTDFSPQFEIKISEPERVEIGDYIEIIPFKTCHTASSSYGYMILGKASGGTARFSLAYTGDTKPCKDYIEKIKGIEILIHDSTFSEELKEEAWSFGHSTSKDAALVAKEVGAKILFLFHVSNRYSENLFLLEKEARRFFLNTYVALDGMKFYL